VVPPEPVVPPDPVVPPEAVDPPAPEPTSFPPAPDAPGGVEMDEPQAAPAISAAATYQCQRLQLRLVRIGHLQGGTTTNFDADCAFSSGGR
jgi:hypothetical protein